MDLEGDDIAARFKASFDDAGIVAARFEIIDAAAQCFDTTADYLQTAGWVLRDDVNLATALLARLAGRLTAGIATLLRLSNAYAAAALLRQLIEVEYLAFVGYINDEELKRWYRAEPEELRKQFTPKRMRDASGGLFRDAEYSLHCEVGGHPHPRARMLLPAYSPPFPPEGFLLPDCVHHVHRLWISFRSTLERRDTEKSLLLRCGSRLDTAIASWKDIEDEAILAFDGIGLAHDAPNDDGEH